MKPQLQLKSMSLLLKEPYFHNGFTISVREVARVEGAGMQGVLEAELGPFPGVNQETFAEAWAQLKQWSDAIACFVSSKSYDFTLAGFGLPGAENLFPSVANVVEQLIIHRHFQILYPQGQAFNFRVAGLVVFCDGWEAQLHDFLDKGYRCFKVKLGRRAKSKELEAFRNLVQTLPETCRLRLDTNQSLSLQDIEAFIALLSPDCLEYVEEPSSKHERNTEFPIAYDESVWDQETVSLRATDRLIVKPQRLNFAKIIRWLQEGRVHADQVVLSSCFDGSLALKNYLRFAMLWNLQNTHGFGPFAALLTDSTGDALPPLKGLNHGIVL